jgi:hypothetical protein
MTFGWATIAVRFPIAYQPGKWVIWQDRTYCIHRVIGDQLIVYRTFDSWVEDLWAALVRWWA